MRVRTQAKRDAILEAASSVFAELGYERTSMAEIAARAGGSKATVYGYFASKEALFVAVADAASAAHLAPLLAALEVATEAPTVVLRTVCRSALRFLCSADAVRTVRMVIAQAGGSEIGRMFYETGPRRAEKVVAAYLQGAMARGQLRQADAEVAAQHLMALLNAELGVPLLYGVRTRVGKAQIDAVVDRAVDVFLAAYGP